jgi:phosphohistidine phosphatase SixA
VRARSTAEPIASAFDRDPDEHEALFVDRPASGVIEVVRQTAASNGGAPVVVVGHNPTLALTVGALTEGVNGSAEMKTGQAYVLAFRSPELITPGAGEVVQVLRSEA